jgi:DNA polymerase, archaea type
MTDLDPLLFGNDPTDRIVSVEPDADNGRVVLYLRSESGIVSQTERPFVPWLLSAVYEPIQHAEIFELKGDGYKYRYYFPTTNWKGFLEARRSFRDKQIPVVSYGSQVRQFLLDTGITLFKGLSFDDLSRMQIDIETSSLSPDDTEARIFLIAISDSTGRLELLEGDETEVLENLADRIRRWDPDVIEGHNIYTFDLPYILARCKVKGVDFSIGRDLDRAIVTGNERNCSMGANSRPFVPLYVYGRHIIDTYFQVQRFDSAKGEISSYGLKECAKVYKLSDQDRTIVDRATIQSAYADDPELVRRYARQDVEETRALAALTSPTEFYQTQMAPDVYQSVAVTGTGEKINSLLVREYLRQNHAIPFATQSAEYPGGYTEIRRVGVIKRVVKADVESLYPSIMLSEKIAPSSDRLGLFLPMLSDLTARRLEAKATLKTLQKGTRDFAYWDGLQNSFKTFINSFYGYIGGPFYFNDYSAARQVTVSGQRIVKSIAKELEETGSIVIEIDTDGIYFQPSPEINSEDLEVQYIQEIGDVLPFGIRLAHDGRYESMLSLKIKNYVLAGYDGCKIMKGSSLRSRADEPFGRRFLKQAVDLLLEENYEAFSQLYNVMLADIQEGRMTIDDYAKRERVTEKTINGAQRSRTSVLAKSNQIREGDIISVYTRNDGTAALAADYAHDEDRVHYASKLYKFAARLVEAVGEDAFSTLCPRPRTDEQRLTDRLQESFDF